MYEKILEKYREYLRGKRFKRKTVSGYMSRLRIFLEKGRTASGFSRESVRKYLDGIKNRGSRERATALVAWLEQNGFLNLDKYRNQSGELIAVLLEKYLRDLKLKDNSAQYIEIVKNRLTKLKQFYAERDIFRINEISKKSLSFFVQEIYDQKYVLSTVSAILGNVKKFFGFLLQEGYILFDPSLDIHLPRVPRTLYKDIISLKELAELESFLNLKTPEGLRNLCIIETLYAAGMRVGELIALLLKDIDFEERTILIRNGKGKKDRLVVFSKITGELIQKYIKTARPLLLERNRGQRKTDHLFINRFGVKFASVEGLDRIFREIKKRTGFKKPFHPHILRHTCAGHMLSNGADIRYIQQQLGHKCLNTTQRYTRVVIKELKKTIEQCHPLETGYAGQTN